MKKLTLAMLATMLLSITTAVYAANLDDFNGPDLDEIWTYRDPASNGEYTFEGGKMILDLKAGADMYKQGTDAGVMFLTDPPVDTEDFSVELLVNPAVDGPQPLECHVGIVFFREDEWAYSAWGPYEAADIRLEDCIDQDYRWRDQAQIAVDVGDVAIDEDVYISVVKTGNELEFFAKGDEGDQWLSGGVDTKLGPHYTSGDYQVGIIAKSWAGSVDSTFEFDYFNIPERSASVAPTGKLATTWATLKK